ncbi:helix-turn-helix transcriptional regulator [Tissierella carlieri]|uniref:Helix-turn-helix transcriptional regulator n=1 Tax=Tissierella carlieri TaxID=689904 RepID=A0ABT1SEA2_9FIRM|nr:helix-turn-helix transcriptional regulator [Tissierella carlieri]MCQ4924822.1 helix-turn-helix transcriptional regulator [Tissierella carlieri]
MLSFIETPDVLPNNMKQIRTMRGKTTNDVAEALSLNHSYISVVENWKSSISSITAFKLMNYLNANFEQFFDMKKVMKLPYTIETLESISINLILDKSKIELTDAKNIIYIENEITKELKRKKIDGKVESFEISDKQPLEEDLFNVSLNVNLVTQKQIEREFNIDLLSEMNYDLFVKLNEIGFTRKKKVPLNAPVIDLKDDIIKIKEQGKIKAIEYEVSFESMNNIEFIQEYLKLRPEDVRVALGIAEKTYNNILVGTQKIPLKVMWRMVALFKVPLELIINVPLYMEEFND